MKSRKFIWYFISFVVLATIIFLCCHNIYTKDYVTCAFNAVCIPLAMLMFLFPNRFYLVAIIAFIYSILLYTTRPECPFNFFVFTIATNALNIEGFYSGKKRKRIGIIITGIIFFLIILTSLRFGKETFFKCLCMNFVFSVFYIFITILGIVYVFQLIGNNSINYKCLNLTQYESITEEDKIIIKSFLKAKKYDEIANELNKSTPYIKKRAKFIFDTFEVPDLISFLSTYRRYDILFTKEDVMNYNKKVTQKI